MVCGKNIPRNKRLDVPVYLQDIMPSTLELAGVEIPEHVQFKSLFPLIEDKESVHYDAIYGAFMDLQRMVTDNGFKLIMYPRVPVARLYDLKEDPYEMKDLAGDPAYDGIMKDLFKSFLELQKKTGDTLDVKVVFPHLM
jgi:choline-sulfatase